MSKNDKELGQRIRGLRERIGISQGELAKKLGRSRPKVSQIEAGQTTVSTVELMKLSEIFNVNVSSLLGLEKEPEVILPKGETKGRKKIKPQIRISVPQKNLEKFKEVLLYLLSRVGSKPNVGETVIYKLLYFIDFNYYELYEEQLIGATYQKNKHGPTPIEFKKIVDKMIEDEDIVKIKSNYFNFPQRKYLPLREPDLSKLTSAEREIVDRVLRQLSDMNAAQISDYSHNDVPWLTTEDGGIIDYESVFYRTPPYSVRQYSEDIP